MVDQKEYSYTDQGLNFVVYDKIAKCVIGGAGFDKTKKYMKS